MDWRRDLRAYLSHQKNLNKSNGDIMSAILVKQEEITASENVIPIYVVRDNEWPQFKLSL